MSSKMHRHDSVIQNYQQANNYCLYDHSLITHFTPDMLSPAYWQAKKAITGTAQGRGTTWFIRYIATDVNQANEEATIQQEQQTQQWVLRHYYRGGLIGKLIKDSYLFNGINNSRAMREFALLEQLQHWQLPAPKPVACRVTRHGLFGLCYRADLLSSRIEDAQDLVAILSKNNINDELWRKVGATIKRFHDRGIYHHDLNAHNILINQQDDVYLIDFDRGELRQAETKNNADEWKEANIARLQRSFLKELSQLEHFHFTDNHWQILRSGYNNTLPTK
jgi:3-deoxy-D-manno-octulosonic acid kinase